MNIQEKIDEVVKTAQDFRSKNPECVEIDFKIKDVPYEELKAFAGDRDLTSVGDRMRLLEGKYSDGFVAYVWIISVPLKITTKIEAL
jgi:hypothetical protein